MSVPGFMFLLLLCVIVTAIVTVPNGGAIVDMYVAPGGMCYSHYVTKSH